MRSLQDIASGSSVEPQVAEVTGSRIRNELDTLTTNISSAYKDPNKAFNAWRDKTKDYQFGEHTTEHYWKTFEKVFPGTTDQARDEIRKDVLWNLDYRVSDTDREFYLRDQMSKLPGWARGEFGPKLEQLSAQALQQNQFKATMGYQKELYGKMPAILQDDLDPDVSVLQHEDDMKNLIRHGLEDMARVVDGRIGVLDREDNFRPGFAVQNRGQILEGGAEISLMEQIHVDGLSETVVRPAVEANLANARQKIEQQNRIIQTQTAKAMKAGDVSAATRAGAFGVMPDYDLETKMGWWLEGEMAKGRIKTAEDLQREVFLMVKEFDRAQR